MPKKSDPTAQAQEAQAALLAVASAYSMVSACLGEGLAEPRLPAVGGALWKRGLADGEQLGDWLTTCVMKTVNSRRAGAAQKLLSRETVRTHLGASGPYGSRAGGSEPSDLLRGVEQLEKQLGKENGEPRELSRCEEAAPSPKRAALSERNPSASQAQMPARAAARAFEGRDQGALRRLGETLDGAALGDVLHGAPANVVGEAVGSLGPVQQVEVMRQCVQRLPADGEALLPILDALGARVFVRPRPPSPRRPVLASPPHLSVPSPHLRSDATPNGTRSSSARSSPRWGASRLSLRTTTSSRPTSCAQCSRRWRVAECPSSR